MNNPQIDQVFATAATRELEANEFYRGVAGRMADPAVRDIFKQLADEEMGHYELIEKFRADSTLILKIAAPVGDWKVAESEELPRLSLDMKPKDAIALAMKKEQQAVEFYQRLAASSSAAEVRDMFQNLANMELGHKRQLETVFVEIGYPEVF